MTFFDRSAATKLVEEFADWPSITRHGHREQIEALLAASASLASAVEYIGELEARHENTVQKLGRQLGYEGIRGMNSETIADEIVVEITGLEAEVARVNGVIAAARTYLETERWDDPNFDPTTLLAPVSTEPERNNA